MKTMARNETLQEQIEALIDGASLTGVLTAIVETCWGKAEHLEANWRAKEQAREWDVAAKRVSSACDLLLKKTHL